MHPGVSISVANRRRMTVAVPRFTIVPTRDVGRVVAPFTNDSKDLRQPPTPAQRRVTVDEIVREYEPRQASDFVWDRIEAFVKEAVQDIPNIDAAKASRYVSILTRHVQWTWQTCGYPLERSYVFAPAVIGESIEQTCAGLTDASKRTFRSNLLAMADALTDRGQQKSVLPPIPRTKASAPYTAREVARLRTWASSLSTQHRRVTMTTVLGLGLGAGLKSSEIAGFEAGDVTVDEYGVLLSVRGDSPREVPMLTEWSELIAALSSATMRRDQKLVMPRREAAFSRHALNNLIAQCDPPVPLTTHRMRATWIVGHLAVGIPATTLAKAAGLASTDALRLYLPFIPELDQREYRVRLIHGRDLFDEDDA